MLVTLGASLLPSQGCHLVHRRQTKGAIPLPFHGWNVTVMSRAGLTVSFTLVLPSSVNTLKLLTLGTTRK